MPRMLITGGCGFIGSNFVRHLLKADQQTHLVNLDKLTYAGNLSNLADLTQHPRYEFVQGDVADRDCVRRILRQGIDGIIHFAAESHVDRSIHDASPFIQTNIVGTQVLLDAAREFGAGRYLQVSTDEVYGSLGADGYFVEETPLAPRSPYAASKASADLLVASYVHTHGFPGIITRCSNNYGPYQFPEKLIPLFITNLMSDQAVPVYGDGQQVRDWIHVHDHCAAIQAVWQRGQIGEVYNIGGLCERTNLDITHLLLNLLGKPRTLIRYVKDRPGHDRRYAMGCDKITRELGWRPMIDLDEGLRQTVQWYQDNDAWVQSVRSGEYRRYVEKQYGRLAA